MPTIKQLVEAERRRGVRSPAAIRAAKDKREATESLRKRCPYLFAQNGERK